jgi:hypothetical protein
VVYAPPSRVWIPGRYETRLERDWVPGYWTTGRSSRNDRDDDYDGRGGARKVWVPGHYENVRVEVWVPGYWDERG